MEILNKNKFMFWVGKNFNIPEEYEYVTVIGEAKINPSSIKSKKNYITFRDYINNNQNKVYFVIIYVFDYSYEKFWNKNFINKDNVIVCYIPKLFNKKHLDIYDDLIKECSAEAANNEISSNLLPEENQKNLLLDSGFLKEMDKRFLSLINKDENDEKTKIKTLAQETIKENEIYKTKFNSIIKLFNFEKKEIDDTRKLEDNLLKKKREREDKTLLSKYQQKIKSLELLLKTDLSTREEEDNSK